MSFNIILLGAPGSGKGTQALKLASKYNLYNFSLGNVIREEIQSKSKLGAEMEAFVKAGLLIPDEVILKLFEAFFNQFSGNGFISDGFPRNLNQATFLDACFASKNMAFPKIVYLKLHLELLLERLLGRSICTQCGSVFHNRFSPSKIPSICDQCHNTLTVRADDTEAVIIQRFHVFQKEINPLLDYYQDRIIEIEGSLPPEKVFEAMTSSIQESVVNG